MRKLAVIGASYLQNPLILKAGEMGLETHVFAWQCGDVGETTADYFYPISIVEKDAITEKCREIGIDGICTIATDLGAVTVNYVANRLGLTGNTEECTLLSTNKHAMRKAFAEGGDPSPKSFPVSSVREAEALPLHYPVIVKPTDRSGSRGITKLTSPEGLADAIAEAQAQGFEKKVLVEEFAEGQEYSVECISYHGSHTFLAMTKKYTTEAPHFIETAHLEPAPVREDTLSAVKSVVFHALDTLKIQNGASHSELKIAADGTIRLIEIGGRMGGDCIGSDLVQTSTGVDFIRAVVQIALGEAPDLTPRSAPKAAAIRFVFTEGDLAVLEKLKREHPEYLIREEAMTPITGEVTDSSTRFGAYLFCAEKGEDLLPYLPEQEKEAVLVCDFDGTLATCDSEQAMVDYFRKTKKLGFLQYLAAGLALLPNTLRTKREEPRLVRGWCAFRSKKTQEKLIEAFLRESGDGVKLNPAVLELIRNFEGRKILLTGSDERMVRGLLAKHGLGGLFHEVIGAEVSAHGLRLLRHPYGKSKLDYVSEGAAVGIGDSFADRYFLECCTKAYVVRRKADMVAYAQRKGWEIIG